MGNFIIYVLGDDIMHVTDSCRFLISSAFKLTALCTILPHCVQSYRTGALKGGMGPETSHVLCHH